MILGILEKTCSIYFRLDRKCLFQHIAYLKHGRRFAVEGVVLRIQVVHYSYLSNKPRDTLRLEKFITVPSNDIVFPAEQNQFSSSKPTS